MTFSWRGKKYRINVMKMHNGVLYAGLGTMFALLCCGFWLFATMSVAILG